MQYKIFLIAVSGLLMLFQASGNERKLIAEGQKLERARKYAEAVAFYDKAVRENPELSVNTQRFFLNRCGYWERDVRKKMDFFRRACLIKSRNATENYRTCLWLGGCYRQFSLSKALGYFQNMQNIKEIHPSLVFQGNMEIGKVYETFGKKALAIEAYKRALAAGKSITYKYNYSAAEKALARLNQK